AGGPGHRAGGAWDDRRPGQGDGGRLRRLRHQARRVAAALGKDRSSARRLRDIGLGHGRATVSGSRATGRLDQAVAAFVRQEVAAPVSGIIGFVDILLEDARRDGLDDFIPDLERMRTAAAQLLSLIERIVDGTALDAPNGLGDEPDRSKLRHELRTPLNAIKGYGELLLEEALEGGHQTFLKDLGAVLEQADRLLADIDRLVAFGEGPSGPVATPP